MRRVRLALAAALGLWLGCSHGEPFAVPAQGTDQPLVPGVPTRLTYSALSDSQPAWLPDGSALLYSARRLDLPDTTTCLEFLPPTGGSASRSICPFVSVWLDSTRALQAGAVSPSGRVAYLRSARTAPNLGWSRRQLELLDPGAAPRLLTIVPESSATVPPHNDVAQIRWLDDNRFVYRAGLYYLFFPCLGYCPPLEADSGRFVVLADLTNGPAVFSVVPGTQGTTSLATAGSDTILFTTYGDSRVHREVLSTGVTGVAWDFGAGHTVVGVQIAGSRLVAIVDGTPWMADLQAATSSQINPGPYSTPALSPDGKRLLVLRGGDLWLFNLP